VTKIENLKDNLIIIINLKEITCSCIILEVTLTNNTISPPIKIMIKINVINPEKSKLTWTPIITATLQGITINLLIKEDDWVDKTINITTISVSLMTQEAIL